MLIHGGSLNNADNRAVARRALAARTALAAAIEPLEGRKLFSAGDFDPSFGGEGSTSLNFEPFLGTKIINNETRMDTRGGKTVAVGTLSRLVEEEAPPKLGLAIARVTDNGSPDSSFDGDGRLLTTLLDAASDVFIAPDGKTLISGTRGTAAAVIRLNANGSVDNSFGGGDGLVTFAFNESAGVRVDGSGRVLVGGAQRSGSGVGTTYNYAAARLTASGAPDKSFDGDGQIITNLKSGAAPQDVAVGSDNKLVLVGGTTNGSGLAVVRLGTNGKPDTSFSGDGLFTHKLSATGFDSADSVAIDGNGRIVVGARRGFTEVLPIRVKANGTIDKVYQAFGSQGGTMGGIFAASDGKVVGFAGNITLRYNADGNLDTSFGGLGYTNTGFASSAGDLQANKNIVSARGGNAGFTFSRAFYVEAANRSGIGSVVSGKLTVDGTALPDNLQLAAVTRVIGGVTREVLELQFTHNFFDNPGATPFFRAFAASSISQFVFSGGAGNDLLGSDSDNETPPFAGIATELYGDDGNDNLHAGDALGGTGSLYGGNGNDQLTGNSGTNNVIDGGPGDDVVRGENGSDFLRGGPGADTNFGNEGFDAAESDPNDSYNGVEAFI